MIQFLLAAPRSGSGKTTMTCALLMALKRRGSEPCAFRSLYSFRCAFCAPSVATHSQKEHKTSSFLINSQD